MPTFGERQYLFSAAFLHKLQTLKEFYGVIGFKSRSELLNLSSAEETEGLVPDGVIAQTYK